MTLLSTILTKKGDPVQSTPAWLYRELDAEFEFQLDVCASPDNAKCESYFTEADDGLAQAWGERACWMNPPFNGAGVWIERAWYAAKDEGATVVCILPVWSDLSWWHRFVLLADEIRFIRGRVKFGNWKNAAPFPLCVVVFRPGPQRKDGPKVSGRVGHD